MSDLKEAAELVLEAHDKGYGKIAHDAAMDLLRQAVKHSHPEPQSLTPECIREIWDEQWAKHKGTWAEEFVYQLGKSFEKKIVALHKLTGEKNEN